MTIKQYFTDLTFNFQNILASFIVFACFLILILVMYSTDSQNPHIAEVRTVAGNILVLVIGYFFGSSKGSKEKDKVITDHITGQP